MALGVDVAYQDTTDWLARRLREAVGNESHAEATPNGLTDERLTYRNSIILSRGMVKNRGRAANSFSEGD